jgi:hypothetical protein
MMENKLDLRTDETPSDYVPARLSRVRRSQVGAACLYQPTSSVDNFVKKYADFPLAVAPMRLRVSLMTKTAR